MTIYHCNLCNEDFEVRGNIPPRNCKKCGSWKWNLPTQKQIMSEQTETKGIDPELLKSVVKEVYKEVKSEIKGEEKPAESTIDKFEKWLPYISQFMQGLFSGIQASREREMLKREEEEIPEPPPFYGTLKMVEFQRWNPETKQMEYEPAYKEKLEKYENYLRKNYPQLNIRSAITHKPSNPNNISKPEVMKEKTPNELTTQELAVKKQDQERKNEEEFEMKKIQSNIKNVLNYIHNIDNDKFKNYVDNIDKYISEWKSLINPITRVMIFQIIPKEVIKNTTFVELLEIMKTQLPDKYEIAKSKKHELEQAFNELKDTLLETNNKERKSEENNKEKVMNNDNNNSRNDEPNKKNE